jgi:predicted lipid-binding transport protein (Tim44 family)
MKKIGIFLLAALILLSLTGCSGKESAKARSEQFQSTPKANQSTSGKRTPNQNSSDKSAPSSNSSGKSAPDQSTPANGNSVDKAATSSQITSLDTTLKSLNEAVKSLEDVTSDELTIPAP